MKIPFLDLRIQDDSARQAMHEAIDMVFRHGRFIMGPEVKELEGHVAAYCGRKFAVGVNSGTDALYMALKLLDIEAGDEVITTALSWIATANAISLTGAEPVFADIGDDLNLDPESVNDLITPRTKAIVPVHYTGNMCPMRHIMEIARDRRIPVVEDAAQAFGASLDGKMAGSFGTISCFSMNPMKVLGGLGEAGMLLMDDEQLYNRATTLRYNGMVNREVCVTPGHNGRIDTLQAAALLVRLRGLDEIIAKRNSIARAYNQGLPPNIITPNDEEGRVYYTYTIQTDRRDELKRYLESRGIEAKVRDPYLMPEQPAYKDRARGSFPNARGLVGRLLSLPMYEKLSLSDAEYVFECVGDFFSK